MKFTIIGMGKTGHTTACYLLNSNQEVVCWDRNAEKLNLIRNNGIEIEGQIEGHFTPKVEPELKKAIAGANYILVNTLASGHKDVAKLLQGNLQNNQGILIFNSNWGVYEFVQILGTELIMKNITVSETGGMHLMSDLMNVGHCRLKKIKKSLTISTYPLQKDEMVINELKEVFPQLVLSASPVMTSMNTSNPILHAPIALCSFSKIEFGVDNFFYKEGASRQVVKYIERVDNERLNVMKSLHMKPLSCLEIVNKAWGTDCKDLYEAIHLNYPTSKGPKDINYRFITEDVPFGIVPIAKLGRLLNISTPYCDTLIDIFSKLMDRDFLAEGPNIQMDILTSL